MQTRGVSDEASCVGLCCLRKFVLFCSWELNLAASLSVISARNSARKGEALKASFLGTLSLTAAQRATAGRPQGGDFFS